MSQQLDSESRLTEDDHLALRLWLRVLTCTNLIEGQLRGKLRESFQSTLPRFDLLSQLERNPKGLTMGELSSLMMVSGGNVTGLVTQLVKEELVSRTPMESDRRTYLVKLTAKGKRHFSKMAKSHESWIIDLFSSMSHDEQESLMDMLGSLKITVKAASERNKEQ
jgi:DNA-binding MarR family transcriptional regulator